MKFINFIKLPHLKFCVDANFRKFILLIAMLGFVIDVACKSLVDFSDLIIPMSEKMQLPRTALFQSEATISRSRLATKSSNLNSGLYAHLEFFTGAITLSNGDRYLGQMKFGIPNGDGLLLFKDGNTYFGGFTNGRYEGDGAYFSINGEKFIGQFQGNQKHGNGKTFFTNGSFHEGQYQFDLIEGIGIFTSADGNKFFGDFTLGNFSQKGVFLSKDSQKFYIKKLKTTWVIDLKQSSKKTDTDVKFRLDFSKKDVSTHVAESCSKLLGISFPADSLNEKTWNQFKACVLSY
jgi:hypothetical protein